MRKVKTTSAANRTTARRNTTATTTTLPTPKTSGFKWSDLVGQQITKVVSVDGDHLKMELSNGTTFYVQGQGPVAFSFVTEVKTRSDFYHEMPNFLDSETASNLECLQTEVPPGYTQGQTVAEFSGVHQLGGPENIVSLLQIPFKSRITEKGTTNAGSTATPSNQ